MSYGSFFNELYAASTNGAPAPVVGGPAKEIGVQEDTATRVGKGGMSEGHILVNNTDKEWVHWRYVRRQIVAEGGPRGW